MKTTTRLIAAAALAACSLGAYAQKGETVKIAWIDPLSGLMAPVGSNQLKSFQFFCREVQQDQPGGCQVRGDWH